MNIAFLHGFFSSGAQWSPVLEKMKSQLVFDTWSPNLLQEGELSPRSLRLNEWAKTFHCKMDEKFNEGSSKILVAYSMGGRLALHALLQSPQKWDAAVIVSANPGGLSGRKKEERLKWRNQWVSRFEQESLRSVLNAWNDQPVFQGGHSEIDALGRVTPALLVEALKKWDVTEHDFKLQELKELSLPILWVCGKEDSKYSKLYESLQDQGIPGEFVQISGAGHRVLADEPDKLAELICQFLQRNILCTKTT